MVDMLVVVMDLYWVEKLVESKVYGKVALMGFYWVVLMVWIWVAKWDGLLVAGLVE
jgi:hypothetical protein